MNSRWFNLIIKSFVAIFLLKKTKPLFVCLICEWKAGYAIRKGWHVNIDATCIHYDPDLYPQPLQFNPSRFDVTNKLSSQLFHFRPLVIFLGNWIVIFLPLFLYIICFLQEMQKPYSFIPFGAGPRTCLGINMAKVTMLVFLHRLTSEYKWV